jgi:transcriptional regulator with XRE-family HTH domain
MSSLKTPQHAVRTLGEFIREQRAGAHLSLRELAKQAGISNPYLSQIERGLRKPSADILQQLAKALRISAETLYQHAGLAARQSAPEGAVPAAILADGGITDRQKQVLLDIYQAFHRENTGAPATPPG